MVSYASYHVEHRRITIAHYLALPLMITICGIGGYRILAKQLRSRLDIMPMSIAGKSIVFLAYMIWANYKRKKNLKACLILNGIEPIRWLAAAILPVIGMVQGCSVTGCILSGVLVGLSVTLLIISIPVAIYSFNQWRFFQRTRVHPRDACGTMDLHERVPSATSSTSQGTFSRQAYDVQIHTPK